MADPPLICFGLSLSWTHVPKAEVDKRQSSLTSKKRKWKTEIAEHNNHNILLFPPSTRNFRLIKSGREEWNPFGMHNSWVQCLVKTWRVFMFEDARCFHPIMVGFRTGRDSMQPFFTGNRTAGWAAHLRVAWQKVLYDFYRWFSSITPRYTSKCQPFWACVRWIPLVLSKTSFWFHL